VFIAMREADPAHPGIDQLHHDHLLLREDFDTLAAAAAAHSTRDPDRLAALARGLIISLEQHLRSEAAALAELGDRYRVGGEAALVPTHRRPGDQPGLAGRRPGRRCCAESADAPARR